MGNSIRYTLLRRKNQKHVRIRINGNGSVRVSAPEAMRLTQIETAVETKKEWILRQSANQKKKYEERDPTRTIIYNGELYQVNVLPSKNGRNRVTISAAKKHLNVRTGSPEKRNAEAAIAGWLKRKARQELLPRSRLCSAATGIPFKNLYIRNQKSRWGSSSGRGNISLNYRIIMAPTAVQQYLIIHELCHQRNFNHSRNYWKDIGTFCPDYQNAERWLKEHSILLSLFR